MGNMGDKGEIYRARLAASHGAFGERLVGVALGVAGGHALRDEGVEDDEPG